MSHSCEPNTKIAYQDHNNNLAVVATKAVKAGEELHVGFIDQKNGELSTEQRRQELFQHYRFKCMCPRCEAPEPVAVAAAVVAEAEADDEVDVEVEAEAKAEVEAVEEVTA